MLHAIARARSLAAFATAPGVTRTDQSALADQSGPDCTFKSTIHGRNSATRRHPSGVERPAKECQCGERIWSAVEVLGLDRPVGSGFFSPCCPDDFSFAKWLQRFDARAPQPGRPDLLRCYGKPADCGFLCGASDHDQRMGDLVRALQGGNAGVRRSRARTRWRAF